MSPEDIFYLRFDLTPAGDTICEVSLVEEEEKIITLPNKKHALFIFVVMVKVIPE